MCDAKIRVSNKCGFRVQIIILLLRRESLLALRLARDSTREVKAFTAGALVSLHHLGAGGANFIGRVGFVMNPHLSR